MPDSTTPANADILRTHLEALKRLRGSSAKSDTPPRLKELKAWQTERLDRTYRDLARTARYREATAFFLDDLYGSKDFSARDEAMLRIHPVMVKLLPESAVETAALAIEVDALSETLDRKLAKTLPEGPITDASYAKAYRESSTPAERERQIELVEEVGARLDELVAKPAVFQMLKMMRIPAKLAGLSDLQSFLERGFTAFRTMGGAKEFLATIARREREIASRIFSASPAPFS